MWTLPRSVSLCFPCSLVHSHARSRSLSVSLSCSISRPFHNTETRVADDSNVGAIPLWLRTVADQHTDSQAPAASATTLTWCVAVIPAFATAGALAPWNGLVVVALETREAGGALSVRVALADARLQVSCRAVVSAGQLGVACAGCPTQKRVLGREAEGLKDGVGPAKRPSKPIGEPTTTENMVGRLGTASKDQADRDAGQPRASVRNSASGGYCN